MKNYKAFVTIEDETGVIREISLAHPYPDRKEEKPYGNCSVKEVSFDVKSCLFSDCFAISG